MDLDDVLSGLSDENEAEDLAHEEEEEQDGTFDLDDLTDSSEQDSDDLDGLLGNTPKTDKEPPMASKKKVSKKKVSKKKVAKKAAAPPAAPPAAPAAPAAPPAEAPAPRKKRVAKKKRVSRKAGSDVLADLQAALQDTIAESSDKEQLAQLKIELRAAKAENKKIRVFGSKVAKAIAASDERVAALEAQIEAAQTTNDQEDDE